MIIELGRPLAYGRTAEIYAWHQGQVLKLFYQWFELERIECEAHISQVVFASGLPVPAVGEIMQVNNRYGLVYERVYGESMFEMLQHRPWNVFRYAWRMAELQTEIHASSVLSNLPLQRQVLKRDINSAVGLPEVLRRKVLSALDGLPDGDRLCHGDFWPGNILMSAKGEVIIDWLRATIGNPLADLARTVNLFLGYIKTKQVKRPHLTYGNTRASQIKNISLQMFCHLCYPIYVKYFFKLNPGDRSEFQFWLPVVAAARMSDNIPELESMLISQIEKYL